MSYKIKNDEVKEIGKMNITGNVIPISWFEYLKFPGGKPQLPAIMILSDIVYWYRPTEIRNEQTGRISHYEQKFKGDMLQKQYDDYVNLFGFGKAQVKNAFDYLVDEKLVYREFRNIVVRGRKINNVMYVQPITKNIDNITYSFLNKEVVISKQGGGSTEVRTNTKSTLESTSKNKDPYTQLKLYGYETTDIYNRLYEIHFDREHPKVKTDKLPDIRDSLLKILSGYGKDFYINMIKHHMTNCIKNYEIKVAADKSKVDYFVTVKDRYLIDNLADIRGDE